MWCIVLYGMMPCEFRVLRELGQTVLFFISFHFQMKMSMILAYLTEVIYVRSVRNLDITVVLVEGGSQMLYMVILTLVAQHFRFVTAKCFD